MTCGFLKCGPKRTRTADPLIANEVLYQLSYGPTLAIEDPRFHYYIKIVNRDKQGALPAKLTAPAPRKLCQRVFNSSL
ncbi:MAG: hypothetical protein UW79_C0020G0023 [Candidatus Yanofskybacteria bacterium GW2011_GWA2_44_9]|uniref:Uncharacterized protein n=1 Tax=Candidatus Yanofskybacteria bacterium GW2011_GWA2_44_9 TaxID=1619025 RepID=A0A0G1NB40_9BACT|nr:MAG: hypothetical protein UW79_C0020G0023 [Candidatus Yanofskybacteria bacterium GW2011_GWA2_44_9]